MNPIPLSRPLIGEEEAEAAARVVRSGWLAQGPEVAALEREFAAYFDAADPPHVVAVSSCTAALHLCVYALAGARVVFCPSYTFVATVNAVRLANSRPILCDVDPRTYNLDPAVLFSPLLDLPRYVIALPVHQVGLPADIDGMKARLPGAVVLEDAACAIGARYPNGARVGTRRDTIAACFSLHGSKSVVAGEGGLVATHDADFAERVRRLRQHGVDVAAENRKGAEQERYLEVGWNYRMTDMQAAVARVQLGRADTIVGVRRARAARYTDALAKHVTVPVDPHGGHAFQRYLVRTRTPDERERLVARLTDAGVSCRRGLQVVHRQPAWDLGALRLPVTEEVADTTVQLPLWAGMTHDEQDRVIAVVRGAS